MKEQNRKGSVGDRTSLRIRDRVVAAQTRINPAPVVDEQHQIIGLATRTGIVELIARLEAASS